MTPEDWQRVKPILDSALQLDSARRPAFLKQACADASLRHEIESLIAAHEQADSGALNSASLLRSTLESGTRLGDFQILSLLGSGGMGEVYRARDLRLDRDVAIKVLPSFVSLDPERLHRFEQEAKSAAALNYPNILAVFQMGSYEGAPYLVSELLEGETLREQVKRGPIPSKKAIDYAVQIAHGLAAAHEKSIVHRDLKPENLFVTRDGRIKILDFGLAKLLHADGETQLTKQTLDTQPGAVMGTVGYMAPEQVRGLAADHRADIFAFGAILYEMLTGKRAFHKSTFADTMSAILNEDPPPVSQITSGVPPALERAVYRCLEKSPQQRFQSASDLAFALELSSDSGSASTRVHASAKSRITWKWITVVAVAMALAVVASVWWLIPPAVPVVEAVTQLTDDGVPKGGEWDQGRLVTDGSRIYFNEGATGSWNVAEVAVTGGKTALVPTRLVNPQIRGLTSDNAALLALLGSPGSTVYSLWTIPLPAGEPRRLGGIEAQDAAFSTNGQIIFAQGTGLYIADKDGSNPRRTGSNSGNIWGPAASPDGRQVAFNTYRGGIPPNSLFETGTDGSTLYTVMEGTQDVTWCCPQWTIDGKYLIFQGQHHSASDLWAIPAERGILGRSKRPVQLTNGPLSYYGAAPSRDGKQIFALGTKRRGELIRYDIKSGQFLPFLSGISAIDPTFSRDGQWVAYTSYPDHTLWRSRADGSNRLQLTYSPMEVGYPFISPDGKKVAFGIDKVSVINMDGGEPQTVAKGVFGTWSPDGNFLVVQAVVAGTHAGERNIDELQILDLRTSRISDVPSSLGMEGAWWPTQDTLVAVPEDYTKLVSFDLKTQSWTDLVSDSFVNWAPSLDREYLYYTTGGAEPMVKRVRLFDRKVETIASLKNLRRVVDPVDYNTQLSVAPDGSPVFTRDIGTQEIYSLHVRWP